MAVFYVHCQTRMGLRWATIPIYTPVGVSSLYRLDAPEGLEPSQLVPKTNVLPLNEGAAGSPPRVRTSTFLIQSQTCYQLHQW